jgi:hypothetical protein
MRRAAFFDSLSREPSSRYEMPGCASSGEEEGVGSDGKIMPPKRTKLSRAARRRLFFPTESPPTRYGMLIFISTMPLRFDLLSAISYKGTLRLS